ncbi:MULTISPECIES: hypothetical protein [Burkholderia]|uniref:hypothetical protein n=1 Tax=Burkholderia TaxID=32008 RepID=UPI0014536D87|nr:MULTISPECIES: hypothetical protein [Burkholderia]VWD18229.1 FMN-dependent NADH-azoreductase 4 [Burkholderia contaminans]
MKIDPIGLVEGVSAIAPNLRDGLHIGQETDAITPHLYAALRLMASPMWHRPTPKVSTRTRVTSTPDQSMRASKCKHRMRQHERRRPTSWAGQTARHRCFARCQ